MPDQASLLYFSPLLGQPNKFWVESLDLLDTLGKGKAAEPRCRLVNHVLHQIDVVF